MLRSIAAAAVLGAAIILAFVSDVLAAGARLKSARFDRAYQRNRAIRLGRWTRPARPELRLVGGRHEAGSLQRASKR